VAYAVDAVAIKGRLEALLRAAGFTPDFRGTLAEGAAERLEMEAGPFQAPLVRPGCCSSVPAQRAFGETRN
jgi:hypothetical protein